MERKPKIKNVSLFFFSILLILNTITILQPTQIVRANPDNEEITQLKTALQDGGTIRVIVVLEAPAAQLEFSAQAAQYIAQAQSAVIENVPQENFSLVYRYTTTPGLVANVDSEGLKELEEMPEVRAVALDLPIYPATAESGPLIQADRVHNDLGITGRNINIAIIDSGIDLTHPDLLDNIIAQHCFTEGSCPPYNTAEGDSAADEHGHGTRVAGIITSKGTQSPLGIAPDAGIVAVRVMDSKGAGWTSDVIAALDWIVTNQATLNIKIINMSLGGGLYAGICDNQNANTILYSEAVQAARNAGITLFAASGNQGSSDALIAPACISGVIAVGGTYDGNLGPRSWADCYDATTAADQIACFSSSSSALDLLAPGAWIQSTALGGGQKGDAGTSMATPHAAATAALVLEANPTLSANDIERILKNSGVPVTDPRNGRVTPRINALAAVNAAASTAPEILSGKVLLQGRTTYEGTTVWLEETACGTQSYEFPDATKLQTRTNQEGNFTFTLQPGHPYRCLHIKRQGYLEGQRSIPSNGGQTITLLAGDVIQDNVINIFDLTNIAAQYNSQNPDGDLNIDGMINILDLTMVAGNYGRQGPLTHWP